MKILDTVGSLELSDTGRRCTNLPEDGEIVRVRCTKCDETQDLDKHLAAFFWATKKADGGFHLGCASPEVRERREAERRVLEQTMGPSIEDPPGACPRCHRLDCGGAVV